MEDIKQQIVLTTTAERERELSKELEPLIGENNKKASIAKQLLQKLREATEKVTQHPTLTPSPYPLQSPTITPTHINTHQKQMRTTSRPGGEADVRIRENLANTLTRKFVDVMKGKTCEHVTCGDCDVTLPPLTITHHSYRCIPRPLLACSTALALLCRADRQLAGSSRTAMY
jgi:hypothetical protein